VAGLHHGGARHAQRGAVTDDRIEHRARQPLIGADPAGDVREPHREGLAGRLGLRQLGRSRAQPPHAVTDDGGDQSIPGRKVPVQRADADPGATGDVTQRRVNAFLPDHLPGDLEQFLAVAPGVGAQLSQASTSFQSRLTVLAPGCRLANGAPLPLYSEQCSVHSNPGGAL
jgi:hypothetical protein